MASKQELAEKAKAAKAAPAKAGKAPAMEGVDEKTAEAVEAALEDEEEDMEDDDKLPFPKATIVNMLRKHLDGGKQIKGQVKREMNLWLGKMVERIAEKMNTYPYSYVDGSMFREAIESYEEIQEIEKERERLIKEMEAIKAACDVLIHEVDRKFVLRKGFAQDYLKEAGGKK